MKIFLTADHHFGHRNILKYCPNRKFSSIESHDSNLILKWNERVSDKDIVFHVGDFGFNIDHNNYILDMLKGKKFLITGNHDKKSIMNKDFCSRWDRIYNTYHEIEVPFNGVETTIVLCHYPLASFNKSFHGAFQLHGHIHSTPENRKIPKMKHRRDVGVDSRADHAPWELNELLSIISAEDNKLGQPIA